MLRRQRVLVFAAGAAVALGAGLLAVPGGQAPGRQRPTTGRPRPGRPRPGRPRPERLRRGPDGRRWSRRLRVPGLTALNKGGDTEIDLMSCPSAGNCSVGGFLDINAGAFVASELARPLGKAMAYPAWPP